MIKLTVFGLFLVGLAFFASNTKVEPLVKVSSFCNTSTGQIFVRVEKAETISKETKDLILKREVQQCKDRIDKYSLSSSKVQEI